MHHTPQTNAEQPLLIFLPFPKYLPRVQTSEKLMKLQSAPVAVTNLCVYVYKKTVTNLQEKVAHLSLKNLLFNKKKVT